MAAISASVTGRQRNRPISSWNRSLPRVVRLRLIGVSPAVICAPRSAGVISSVTNSTRAPAAAAPAEIDSPSVVLPIEGRAPMVIISPARSPPVASSSARSPVVNPTSPPGTSRAFHASSIARFIASCAATGPASPSLPSASCASASSVASWIDRAEASPGSNARRTSSDPISISARRCQASTTASA